TKASERPEEVSPFNAPFVLPLTNALEELTATPVPASFASEPNWSAHATAPAEESFTRNASARPPAGAPGNLPSVEPVTHSPPESAPIAVASSRLFVPNWSVQPVLPPVLYRRT